MLATKYGHAKVVETLLQHGASIDVQDNVSSEFIFCSNNV